MSFEGKVILVTGASSGIGADVARFLARSGGHLSMIGQHEELLNEVADEIKKFASVPPLVIAADVTKDAEKIINETVEHFGKLDVLINSTSIYQRDSVYEFEVTLFDDIFNTNVKAVVFLSSLAVPHLEKTKGNIVNVSSVAGIRIIPGTFSYCMSKAALDQFTKCAAVDLAPKGIRVNSVNPAIIRTSIFEKNGLDTEKVEEIMDQAIHQIERIGEVSDTSAAIAYLASESSFFITGIILPVCEVCYLSPSVYC